MGFFFFEKKRIGLKRSALGFISHSLPHSLNLSRLSQPHSLSPLSQRRSPASLSSLHSYSHFSLEYRRSSPLISLSSSRFLLHQSCFFVGRSDRELLLEISISSTCSYRRLNCSSSSVSRRRHYFGLCSSPPTSLAVVLLEISS